MIKDEYSYSAIVDKQEPTRVIAIIASKLDPLPQLPWDHILGDHLIRLPLSTLDATELKNEMMPKDTNNFYQYRRSGKICGYIMFAFQICGQH
jgi:hypothetical protein